MALSPLLSIATHIAIPSSAMASSILCKPFSFTVRQIDAQSHPYPSAPLRFPSCSLVQEAGSILGGIAGMQGQRKIGRAQEIS